MSGGLGDNTNRIPVVATPASAAPDKAWIPLEVLEVVWDFMSEKSELSKAGCDLLSKLIISVWQPAPATPLSSSSAGAKDKDKGKAAEKVTCIFSEDLMNVFPVFRELHQFVSMPALYMLKSDPSGHILNIVNACLITAEQSTHSVWNAWSKDSLYTFKSQLQKLALEYIPMVEVSTNNDQYWKLVKLCGKWWGIEMPQGTEEEREFLGNARFGAAAALTRRSRSPPPRRRGSSPSRRNSDRSRSPARDKPLCPLGCGKKHAIGTCKRCGHASHRVDSCRAKKDICGQCIDDKDGDGRKCRKCVKV